ncbi:hypothetical protein [Tunturiibacter gelidiferens]|uniref:hypothetical protein n=1 Tax=Tunturiibacter gelidiferens TaxID=3069689 RepID=UPI003D9ACD8D
MSLTGAPGIEQATHLLQAWLAVLNHIVDRRLAGENGILVRKLDPAICQMLSVANI